MTPLLVNTLGQIPCGSPLKINTLGFIGVCGEVVQGGGVPKHKRKKQEQYDKAYQLARWQKEQRELEEQALRDSLQAKKNLTQTLRLKKKTLDSELQAKVETLQDEVWQEIAIEMIHQEFKKKEAELLTILLLM